MISKVHWSIWLGFKIPPGASGSIGLTMTKTSNLGQPYGNCSSTDPLLSAKNNNFTRYTKHSCIKRCLQKRVFTKCGCVDRELPINVKGLDTMQPEFCGTLPEYYPNNTCSSAKLDPACFDEGDEWVWYFYSVQQISSIIAVDTCNWSKRHPFRVSRSDWPISVLKGKQKITSFLELLSYCIIVILNLFRAFCDAAAFFIQIM